MFETLHLLGLGSIIVLYLVMKWCSGRKLGKMPGPTPLPIIGNVHQLDVARPYITFTKWAKQYGDVFAIRMLNQDTVVINSAEVAREALVRKGAAFAGRPTSYRAGYIMYNGNDIGFQTYTPNLVHIRKATHSALKSYGVGMARMEISIRKGVSEMLQEMSSHSDKPFCPQEAIHRAICNILLTILTGNEFKPTDIEVINLKKYDILSSEVLNPTCGAELDTFPWLRFFGNKHYTRLVKTVNFREQFIVKIFDRLKETFDPANIRGVFDAFLLQQQHESAANSRERLTDTNIKAIVNDLIIAGTSTTSTSVDFAMLSLIHYPDVQKRLHLEIDQVLGNRTPRVEDRSLMPYVEAFMFEVLRYHTSVPLLLPHLTMEDTILTGYNIPKDTQVLFNCFGIHHDERFYKDPWTFKPERFLNEDGSLVPADHPARKNFFGFGAGRRVCIGEGLGKARLFLFITALVQRFQILPVDSEPLPSLDPRDFNQGNVLFPKPYQIKIIERKWNREKS